LQRRELAGGLPISAFSLFCFVIAISYFWTLHPEVWRRELSWWFVCLGCFWGTLTFIRGSDRIRAMAYAASAAAIATIFQLHSGNFLLGNYYSIEGYNANLTSYALVACAFIILLTLRSVDLSSIGRTVLLLSIALIGVEMIMLFSRASLVTFVAMCITATFIGRIPHWLRLSLAAACWLAAMAVTFGLIDGIFAQIDVSTSKQAVQSSTRTLLWSEALSIIQTMPALVIGIGPGSFPLVSKQGINVHNIVLNVWVSFGALGLMIFYALWATIIGAIRDASRSEEWSQYVLLLAIFAFPIMLTGYADTIPIIWAAIAFSISASGET